MVMRPTITIKDVCKIDPSDLQRVGRRVLRIERDFPKLAATYFTLRERVRPSPSLVRQGRERPSQLPGRFGLKAHQDGERAAEFAGLLNSQ